MVGFRVLSCWFRVSRSRTVDKLIALAPNSCPLLHSSQIMQCLSNVALFVQVSEGDAFVSRRAFVSEGTAKVAGLRRDDSYGAMRQHQALKRIASS